MAMFRGRMEQHAYVSPWQEQWPFPRSCLSTLSSTLHWLVWCIVECLTQQMHGLTMTQVEIDIGKSTIKTSTQMSLFWVKSFRKLNNNNNNSSKNKEVIFCVSRSWWVWVGSAFCLKEQRNPSKIVMRRKAKWVHMACSKKASW